ncbi:MAG TPA: M48 family metallopeptidase [Gemmatimonadaceae bacterium]|nr:M48 family metallopeptidase [Gemmatimonadaceae bacterium]
MIATRARTFTAIVFAFATLSCAVDNDQERAIGEQVSAQVERETPIVNDAEINGYVTSFGTSLASKSDDRNRAWRFRVVDAEQVNAFALPGGFVYVNRGLIERASTASELAGVLGHEIGHVLLRHSAERMEKAQKTNVGVSVVCGLTNLCSSEAARVAINVGGAALFARFSRRDELEADSAAVRVVERAGYDPKGIATMFEALMREREQRPDMVAVWFASHPLEETRIRTVEQVIAASPATSATLKSDEPAFHAFQERVRALPPSPVPATRSVP